MSKKSSWLKPFQELTKEGKELYTLIGSALLVEKMPEDEIKSKGGIVVATPDNYRETMGDSRPIWVRVLAVGEGYYDDGNHIPIEAKAGDICLVGPVSCQWFSAFGGLPGYSPGEIGISREEEIRLRFSGDDGKAKAIELLGRAREEEE